MKNLEKLKAELSSARQAYKKCEINIKDTTEQLNSLNLEVSELTPRATEVARLLDNAKKGIIGLSLDELTSLKKELEDKNIRIQELKEFIPVMKNSLYKLNGTSTGNSRHVRSIKDQVTDIIADKAAAEIATTSTVKLKELTYTSMSLYGVSFTGTTKDINNLYQKIGERLCKQLFTTENESLVLPTIVESLADRDLLLDSLS